MLTWSPDVRRHFMVLYGFLSRAWKIKYVYIHYSKRHCGLKLLKKMHYRTFCIFIAGKTGLHCLTSICYLLCASLYLRVLGLQSILVNICALVWLGRYASCGDCAESLFLWLCGNLGFTFKISNTLQSYLCFHKRPCRMDLTLERARA